MNRTLQWFALAALLASFGWSVSLLHGFVADDAYILYRYVDNFHRFGALVYNNGERINSLTSPLHALVLSALRLLATDVVLLNKALGAACALFTAALVAWRFRHDLTTASFALALAVLPACAVLWTFGGLETPLLMLLTTAGTLMATSTRAPPVALAMLAGLGFLARYDALLFFAPLGLLALVRANGARERLLTCAAGIVPPLAWLAAAYAYYGDILPTSYYIKTPSFGRWEMLANAQYLGAWLVFTGALPGLLVAAAFRSTRAADREPAMPPAARWVAAGLVLEAVYGLTMATSHMMFSFRHFVPYLPAVAILAGEWALPGGPRRWREPVLAAFVMLAAIVHAAQAWTIEVRSVNGWSPVGEFRQVGARVFREGFMGVLQAQADAIAADWPQRIASQHRAPRVSTYVGGLVPYRLSDAYIYDALASYRHGEERYRNFSRQADYVMSLYPRFGPMEGQLPGGPGRYELIFEHALIFDGEFQHFRVYYNPAPGPHTLGDRIDRRTPEPANPETLLRE